MKIAAITITYDDDYKLKEWCDHYQYYKDELYMHIIVDNGSKPEYINSVQQAFPNSIIIKRKTNGGCTAAYNDGMRYALKDATVDSIMHIANDMKIEKGSTMKLYEFLMSDKGYGMVQPILLKKDSDIIENYGCGITPFLYMILYKNGSKLEDLEEKSQIVESIVGGMNIATRQFYESIGLQDETLFMYSDEVDISIRTSGKGYLLAATRNVIAWHQHINPNKGEIRMPYSAYLIGRNKVYLGWKHYGFSVAIKIFLFQLWTFMKDMVFSKGDLSKMRFQIYFLLGSINGLFRNMKLRFIIT